MQVPQPCLPGPQPSAQTVHLHCTGGLPYCCCMAASQQPHSVVAHGMVRDGTPRRGAEIKEPPSKSCPGRTRGQRGTPRCDSTQVDTHTHTHTTRCTCTGPLSNEMAPADTQTKVEVYLTCLQVLCRERNGAGPCNGQNHPFKPEPKPSSNSAESWFGGEAALCRAPEKNRHGTNGRPGIGQRNRVATQLESDNNSLLTHHRMRNESAAADPNSKQVKRINLSATCFNSC
jgi:hypothetical protein